MDDRELQRRIRKAKVAQSKRVGIFLLKQKRCGTGKVCGRTCIERWKKCAVDMDVSISISLDKASDLLNAKKKPAEDHLSVKFSNHLRENSFSVPGRSYNGEDIAKMTNQVASELKGEAKVNFDKMREFVIKMGIGVSVSSNSDDPTLKLNKTAPWTLSREYVNHLDRLYNSQYLNHLPESSPIPALKLAKSFTEAKGLIESRLYTIISELKKDKKEDMEMKRQIKAGNETKKLEKLLDINKGIREEKIKEIIALRNILSELVVAIPGSDGFTTNFQKSVVMVDNLKNRFQRGVTTRAEDLRERISYIIKRRSTSETGEDIQYHTFTFGSLNKGNGNIMMTFLHEVGHQVHYKAGEDEPAPPKDSTSISRRKNQGLTGYSSYGLAHNDGSEAFAEAFVAYSLNPEALKSHDKPLYDWVDNMINKSLSP